MSDNYLFFKCSQREDMKFMKRTLCDLKRKKTKAELNKQGYGFDSSFCPGCLGQIRLTGQSRKTEVLADINRPRVFNKKESIRLYGFEIKNIERIGSDYFMNFISETGECICHPLRLQTKDQVNDYLENLKTKKDDQIIKLNTGNIPITLDQLKEKRSDLKKQREAIERDIMSLDTCIKMFE